MNYFHDIEYASGQYEKRMGINELIFTNSATSVRTATIQFFTEHRRNRDSVYQCFFGNAFATTIRSIIAWIAIRSSRVSKCSLNWKWIIMRQYICWTFNYTASYWDVRAQVYARQINRYSMKIKLQQMVYLVLWKARRATVGKVDGPRNWVMSNGKATGIFCKELRQSLKIL